MMIFCEHASVEHSNLLDQRKTDKAKIRTSNEVFSVKYALMHSIQSLNERNNTKYYTHIEHWEADVLQIHGYVPYPYYQLLIWSYQPLSFYIYIRMCVW